MDGDAEGDDWVTADGERGAVGDHRFELAVHPQSNMLDCGRLIQVFGEDDLASQNLDEIPAGGLVIDPSVEYGELLSSGDRPFSLPGGGIQEL